MVSSKFNKSCSQLEYDVFSIELVNTFKLLGVSVRTALR